jgi:hypothetical protein
MNIVMKDRRMRLMRTCQVRLELSLFASKYSGLEFNLGHLNIACNNECFDFTERKIKLK